MKGLKNKSKSERIEKTRELLAESEPEKLDLSVGEIARLSSEVLEDIAISEKQFEEGETVSHEELRKRLRSDEVLIKKTEDGFILYYVVAKEDVTPETCPQLD